MFDNIPIIKRWKFIIGIIAFAFLVSLLYGWQVLDLYGDIEQLKHKTAIIEDADLQIVNRQVRLKELSDKIRNMQNRGVELNSHVALMQYIETACLERDLLLIQLPQAHIEDLDGYQVSHVQFSIEGMFHDILRLIYQIESKDRIGSIAKADLELKNMRIGDDRAQMLVATIHLNRLVTSEKKLHSNADS